MAMRLSVLFNGQNADLVKSAKQSEGAVQKFAKTAVRAASVIGAAYAAIQSAKMVVNVIKNMQRMEAQLLTATGSVEGMANAMEVLRVFANETGQDLQSVTTSFTRLVNLGLNPSKEALLAYANVAAATGKTTIDFVEAVADAATAEFERLKEFGIRAKNQGDTVAFTFRGVTTEVANNATAIENYLISLGQNEFGDAMANQSQTLEAALTRAGNAWDEFIYAVTEGSVGDVVTDGVNAAADALQELASFVGSGQATEYLDAYAGQWQYAFREVIDILEYAYDFIVDNAAEIQDVLGEVGNFAATYPIQLRYGVDRVAVELMRLVDIGAAYGEAFYEVVKAQLRKVADYAVAIGRQVGDALQFWEGDQFDFTAAIEQANQQQINSTIAAFQNAQQQVDAANAARMQSIELAKQEREQAIATFQAQIAGANEMREAYDRQREARQQTDLGQFRTGGEQTGPQFNQSGALAAGQNSDFDKLIEQLKTEEERINESYIRRREMILANTQETSQARQDLLRRLDEQYAQDMLGPQLGIDQSYQSQIEQINQEYQLKREAVLANTALTEEQKTALIEQLTQQRNNRIKKLEAAQASATLGTYASLFGNMADVAKAFGGEQSKTYKALFAVSKAFSIAQSIISIQTGIAQAASLPFPGNLAAMATVAAETASIISTIKGTQFQGQAHDGISRVPAANEGTWMLKKGEMVLNNKQRDNFEYLVDYARAGGGRNSGNTVVHIHNKIDIDARGASEGTEQSINDALEIATQRMKQELAEDFSSGGPLSQRLRSGGVAA